MVKLNHILLCQGRLILQMLSINNIYTRNQKFFSKFFCWDALPKCDKANTNIYQLFVFKVVHKNKNKNQICFLLHIIFERQLAILWSHLRLSFHYIWSYDVLRLTDTMNLLNKKLFKSWSNKTWSRISKYISLATDSIVKRRHF